MYAEQRRVNHPEIAPRQPNEGVVKTSMRMRLLLVFAMSAGAVPCLVVSGVHGAVQKVFRFN